MDWNANTATALATWVLVVGTLGAVIAQARSVARSRSAESYLSLVERWDSPNMREKRRRLARALRDEYKPDEVGDRVEDILDFFEDVGIFVKLGYLNKHAAWGAFSDAGRYYGGPAVRRTRISAGTRRMIPPSMKNTKDLSPGSKSASVSVAENSLTACLRKT